MVEVAGAVGISVPFTTGVGDWSTVGVMRTGSTELLPVVDGVEGVTLLEEVGVDLSEFVPTTPP